MKNYSNIRPKEISVERNAGDTADVVYCENISEFFADDEGLASYSWDEYRATVPYRPNLEATVLGNAQAWIEFVKQKAYDQAASDVRDKRNELLADSDSQALLDRIAKDATSLDEIAECLRSMHSAEWTAYRQALRDIPQQEGFPFDVTFPEKPKK